MRQYWIIALQDHGLYVSGIHNSGYICDEREHALQFPRDVAHAYARAIKGKVVRVTARIITAEHREKRRANVAYSADMIAGLTRARDSWRLKAAQYKAEADANGAALRDAMRSRDAAERARDEWMQRAHMLEAVKYIGGGTYA
jgi:hypothetical protein